MQLRFTPRLLRLTRCLRRCIAWSTAKPCSTWSGRRYGWYSQSAWMDGLPLHAEGLLSLAVKAIDMCWSRLWPGQMQSS